MKKIIYVESERGLVAPRFVAWLFFLSLSLLSSYGQTNTRTHLPPQSN